MYAKISEEIKQDYYQQNFPNDGQRFVAWYLRNIHLRDMNETRFDITDGSDDKQIDAIVVDDDNNTVFVIQGEENRGCPWRIGDVREILIFSW
ncbi:MAG: hypothetical protein ABIF87_07105 [Pseudomonadota bacterium]